MPQNFILSLWYDEARRGIYFRHSTRSRIGGKCVICTLMRTECNLYPVQLNSDQWYSEIMSWRDIRMSKYKCQWHIITTLWRRQNLDICHPWSNKRHSRTERLEDNWVHSVFFRSDIRSAFVWTVFQWIFTYSFITIFFQTLWGRYIYIFL